MKAPLSSTPSTSDPLYALEKNGKYAIKTGMYVYACMLGCVHVSLKCLYGVSVRCV